MSAQPQNRLLELDFVKGALVVIMVLYHWMNYFLHLDGSTYRYLRFLTPSFAFTTGFLVAHVYLGRYHGGARQIPGRLLRRGAKLLGLVFMLNLTLNLLAGPEANARVGRVEPLEFLGAFFTGSRPVVFSVLVPISYLLIASSGLLPLSRFQTYIFHATSAVLAAVVMWGETQGFAPSYLQIFSLGMLGVSVGHIPMAKIQGWAGHKPVIAAAYAAYLYALWLSNDNFFLQAVGVCLTLTVLYWLAEQGRGQGWGAVLVRLGEYSLLGYIGQIFILQALRRLLPASGAIAGVALLLGLVGTILAVEWAHRARNKSRAVNQIYSAVFA